jgi:uncharacterized protein
MAAATSGKITTGALGANQWRYGEDWPLPETRWSKLYLHSWGRLRPEPYVPGARNGRLEPDTFVQMPPTRPTTSHACAT